MFKYVYLLALFIGFHAASQARVIYVNTLATGSNSGTSWANAYTSLSDAIMNASTNDSLFVASGTYLPTKAIGHVNPSNPRLSTFYIDKSIKIFGSFRGFENTIDERGLSVPNQNSTYLSGDILSTNDSSQYAFHVVTIAFNARVYMDHVTIMYGNADNPSVTNHLGFDFVNTAGGGMYVDQATVSLQGVQFTENRSTSITSHNGGGAGLYANNASVTLETCLLDNNKTFNGNGGAMKLNKSTAHTSNCEFLFNESSNGDEGGAAVNLISNSTMNSVRDYFIENKTNNSGGAIYADESRLNASFSEFEANEAGSCGGAIDMDNMSEATIDSCSFYENIATEDGGALFAWKGNYNIKRSFFIENQAENGGAIFLYNTCKINIENSAFIGNEAQTDYGALGVTRNSEGVVTNCYIIGNNAGNNGGGLGAHDNHGTQATIIATNITVAANISNNAGGGAYDMGGTTSKIRNSIILGNSPDDVAVSVALIPNTRTTITSVAGDTIFFENGATNPNGTIISGPIFQDPNIYNFTIARGSAAHNAGDNSVFNNSSVPDLSHISTDILQRARIIDNTVDLGCFELCNVEPFAPSLVSSNIANDYKFEVTGIPTSTSIAFSYQIEWYKNNSLIATTYTGEDTLLLTVGVNLQDNDVIHAYVYFDDLDAICYNPNNVTTNSITVQLPNSISDVQSKSGLTLYPNPSNGQFNIKGLETLGSAATLMMYDVMGRVVYKDVIGANTLSYQTNIDVQAGQYLIKIIPENGAVINLPITIQK